MHHARRILSGITALFCAAALAGAPVTAAEPQFSFVYTFTVKTPSSSKTANATVSVVRTSPGRVAITLTPDGQPAQTIPAAVAADGTIAYAPGGGPPPDSGVRMLLSSVALALGCGVAVSRKGLGNPITLRIALTPVGNGSPVPLWVTLSPSGNQSGTSDYTGSAVALTNTQLPPGPDGKPLTSLAAGVLVGAVAGPVVGVATGVVATVARVEEQRTAKALSTAPHQDTMALQVHARFGNGKLLAVLGNQSDKISVEGKTVTVTSTWSLTSQ